MENVGSVDQEEEAPTEQNAGRETLAPSRPSQRPRTRCEVCGRMLVRLSAEHLRGHGLTRTRYERLYRALRDPTVVTSTGSPDQSLTGSPDQSPLTTVDRLARKVAGSAAFLDALSAEVSDHILNAAPLRQQVAYAAAQVIQARMAIHADAVGRLSAISEELGQPWRVEQGGSNGGPTPTKDLVSMAMQAHAEIVKAEEMVLKSAKLALEEQKAQDSAKAPTFSFSGAAESIAIPKDLSPADREGLRALMGNLTKYVDASRKARDAITVEGTVVDATIGASLEDQEDLGGALGVTTTPPSKPRRRRASRRPEKGSTDPLIRRSAEPMEGGVSDLDGAGGSDGAPASPTSEV